SAGLTSPLCLTVLWALLISIDSGAAALMFPWDSLLVEITFLAAWLPPLAHPEPQASTGGGFIRWATTALTAPELRISSLPTPLHATMFRYLV
ncbi:hypothetical protein OH407_23665, partial [Salmonella enterica]|uniref:hypothetical protein n=1 Tax=Salmonella enterica TaxID=28901 RepID=UPI0022B733B7